MKKLTKPDLNFNTTNLLFFMYSKRKPLIIVSIFAFVVSVLVSLLITPRFRSTVIFFPASSTSVSNALISTSGSYGEKGFTTEIFKSLIKSMSREELQNTVVFTCGPEIMMHKLLHICLENKIELQASLERIMRCGCGLCGLCVIDPLGLLVCNDGPIFTSAVLEKMEDFGKYKRDFSGKKISI